MKKTTIITLAAAFVLSLSLPTGYADDGAYSIDLPIIKKKSAHLQEGKPIISKPKTSQQQLKQIQKDPNGIFTSDGQIISSKSVKQLSTTAPKLEGRAPKQQEKQTISPFAVWGDDTRTQVKNTTISPYRSIAYLYITKADNKNTWCTGFFVNNDTVVTAAHCVYDTGANKYIKAMKVYPGLNGNQTPYPSVNATRFAVSNSWVNIDLTSNGKIPAEGVTVDYAVVKVPPNTGSNLGHFRLDGSTVTSGKQINIAGYPNDKPQWTMWNSQGEIQGTWGAGGFKLFKHQLDVVGGNSGAPNFHPTSTEGKYQAVGIHSSSNNLYNMSTMLTPSAILSIQMLANQPTRS